jgi:hypothetical protein
LSHQSDPRRLEREVEELEQRWQALEEEKRAEEEQQVPQQRVPT